MLLRNKAWSREETEKIELVCQEWTNKFSFMTYYVQCLFWFLKLKNLQFVQVSVISGVRRITRYRAGIIYYANRWIQVILYGELFYRTPDQKV